MTESPQKPCTSEQASQMDFWLGEWELSWEGGQGSNTITKEFGGCVIMENFDGQPGMDFRGMSVSIYNPNIDAWQQTWVDDQGSYFALTGGLQGEQFILECENIRDGQPVQLRMVFYNITPNSLDWDWQRFNKETETWENNWQIHYQRKNS